MLEGIKEIILVLSGKGGVGKSTVSVCLALAFKEKGYKVSNNRLFKYGYNQCSSLYLLYAKISKETEWEMCGACLERLAKSCLKKKISVCEINLGDKARLWNPFHDVGLLDIDLCGPSVPYLLGVEDQNIFQSSEGWVPLYFNNDEGFGVMSIGFLLKSRNDSIVWRGPKKTSMIKQFLMDVHWQNLDYLIIDTPPGTSDEHITIMENLRNFQNKKAILVTTPQAVAVQDVQKEISFCKKTDLPILGIIENMSGYVCPHCSAITNIFSKGGGESLANVTNLKFLGRLPLDSSINDLGDSGRSLLDEYSKSETSKFFSDITNQIILKNSVITVEQNENIY